MNRLAQLKNTINSKTTDRVEYTDVFVPFALKDLCRTRFNSRWNPRTDSWSVPNEHVFQFEKLYMNDYPTPNKEQKKLLTAMQCTYDKECKLYYLLKFQFTDLENEVDEVVPTDENA